MAFPGFGSISCIIHMIAKIPSAAGAVVGGGRLGKGRSGGSSWEEPEQSASGTGRAGQALFSCMPSPQSRWKLFTATWGTQILVTVSLVNLPLLFPGRFSQVSLIHHGYVATPLVPYHPALSHQPQPLHLRFATLPVKAAAVERPVAKLVLLPPPKQRTESEVKAPELRIESRIPDVPLAPAPIPSAPRTVVTDTFSGGSSAPPAIHKAAAAVQTGGFGDPNGVQARTGNAAVNVGSSGAFDLPVGMGHGNGEAGAHGNPGVVVSSGFGNGIAVSGPRPGGVVQPSGFNLTAVEESHKKPAATNPPPTTSVEILFKPNPQYTEEARKLQVDGEVRLEVVFSGKGEVRVLRVLQGLGHGLDEQAVRVAEQIKFKPALRAGQPVDSTAVVHVVFQLVS